MKELLQENYKKILGGFILLAAALSIGKTVIGLWECVSAASIQSYHVNEQYVENVHVKGVYSQEFLCVGKKMLGLQIDAVFDDSTEGEISYVIETASGLCIVKKDVSVLELKNPEYNGIWLDVSQCGLVQGERYQLTIDFSKTQNFIVALGNGNISIRQYFEFAYEMEYLIGILVIIALMVVWLFFAYKKGLNARLFLITLIVVGLFTVFVQPPVSIDDEYRHFLRAYDAAITEVEVTQKYPTGTESGLIGTYVGCGEFLIDVPYGINEIRLMDYENNYNGYGYVQEQNTKLCLDKLVATLKAEPTDNSYTVSMAATVTKSSLFYWPQIIAMKLGDFFGVNDALLYYFARFGQMLVCIIMETIAIMIAPKLKEAIWLLSFVPNILILKASCNTDGLLISYMILMTAIVVWMKEEKIDLLSRKGLAGILSWMLLTCNIALMKIPYVLCCIGVLVYLGKENFTTVIEVVCKNKKASISIGVVLFAFAVAVTTIIDKTMFLNLLYSFLPENHLTYIMGHFGYIFRLFTIKWIEMFIQLYVSMKANNIIPYPIIIVMALMLMRKNQPVMKRLWYALLFAIMIMVIILVGYTLTPADYGMIWGISFRYLLPFLVVGSLCLPIGNEKTEAIAKQLVPISIFAVAATTFTSWLIGGRI